MALAALWAPGLGAITADPYGALAAFGAGILSFLSPCVLPLVPGYLSMVSGLSASELEALGRDDAAGPRPLGPLLGGIGLFVAGFTVVFVSLGATASGIGTLLDNHKHNLTLVAGGLVVVFGLVMLLGSLPAGVWVRLGAGRSAGLTRVMGERRFALRPSGLGAWAAPVMGMAFAFAWTPCIGPVLGVLLTLAGERSQLVGGVLLLFAYSLGLAVPFVVTGLAFGRMTSLLARVRRRLWLVHLVGGVVLVAFGALLLFDQLGWLSAQFSNLLDHLGLHRLTSS